MILRNITNKNPKARGGLTPLHAASQTFTNVEFFEWYIKKIKDKNPRDNSGMTPLHYAARYSFHMCKIIIQQLEELQPCEMDKISSIQLALNLKNVDGKTPLAIAEQFKNDEVVKFLKRKVEQMNLLKKELMEEEYMQTQTQDNKKRKLK